MDTRLKKALKDFLSSYIKVHNKNLTMDDIEVTFVKGFNAGQMSMKNATSTLTAKVKRYEDVLKFYADPDTYGADDVSRTTGNKQFDIVCFDSDRDFKKGIDMSGKRARAALNQGEGEK